MSSKSLKYTAAGLVAGVSMLLALPAAAASLTDSQINSVISLLSSFGVATSTINTVNAVLHGQTPPRNDDMHTGTSTDWGKPKLPPMWTGSSTPLSLCPQFKHDFRAGDSDSKNEGEVSRFQQYLRDSGAYTGPVTGYFGKLTEGAFEKWQQMASSTATTTTSNNASPRSLFARLCNNIKQGMMGDDDHRGTGTSTASSTAH